MAMSIPARSPSPYGGSAVPAPKQRETEITIFLIDDSVHRCHFPKEREYTADTHARELLCTVQGKADYLVFSYTTEDGTVWHIPRASIVSYSIKKSVPRA